MKSKRFRFNREFDLVLAKTVTVSGAHLAKHGEVEKKFEGVLVMFCASHEYIEKVESVRLPPPKLTTLRDRFNTLAKQRRITVKRNIAASGIAEVYGELEQLLDMLIEEVYDMKTAESEKKDKEDRKEKALVDAAEEIRGMSMKRAYEDKDYNTPRKSSKKKRNADVHIELGSADVELQFMQEEVDSRRGQEQKRLELDERRIALEERRMEIERKERERATENMKATTDLLRVLVPKLDIPQ